MQIIITIGSPWSEFDRVGKTLYSAGLPSPVQTGDNSMSVEALHEQILKSARVDRLSSTIKTIRLDERWVEKALEILQSNIKEETWGCANPFSSWLLDFWKKVDPYIHFVLVYSPPEGDIARFMRLNDKANLSGKTAVDIWLAYNSPLLRFYNRNRDRSILLGKNSRGMDRSRLPALCNKHFALSLEPEIMLPEAEENQDVISLALAQRCLQNRDDVYSLYNELQAAASLPLEENQSKADTPWVAYRNLQNSFIDQQQEKQQLINKINDLQEQNNKLSVKLGELRTLRKMSQAETEQHREENELLQLQLLQVQEELDHYFLLCQKNRTQARQQTSTAADGRLRLQIDRIAWGDNWFPEESLGDDTFRWSGPGPRTFITLSVQRDKEQLLVIRFKQVLEKNQLSGISFEVDGQVVKHKVYDNINPKCIALALPTIDREQAEKTELAITLPYMAKPCEIDPNSPDDRALGIAVLGVSVMPCRPKLYFRWPESLISRSKIKIRFSKLGFSPDGFPLSHFDGAAYMKKYPAVAEAVQKGSIPSAVIHFVQHGCRNGYQCTLADTGLPSEGNELDLTQLFANYS